MEQFVVSARKYRPATFESVVGQDTIATTLQHAIQRKQLAHAYLFCGPRGVGKTTCARIFAKTINCLQPTAGLEACGECESCRSFAEGRSYSIHELDAASNNSVEDIRSLTEQVRVPPQIGKYSVYIIDEVHMLSPAAFNAFLKTLEEPPAHAVFILATTEKHKILPTILSRCQIYDFNRMSIANMEGHLKSIAQKEGITIEDLALNVIAQKADGAMRDALSLFDQAVAFCGTTITYVEIIKNLHVVDYKYYFTLTGYFVERRHGDALLLFDEVLSKGFDALHFIAGLSEHFRNLLVCKDPATLQLFESGEVFKNDYLSQSAQCPVPFLYEALQLANACEMGYKSSGNPRLHVELLLLRLSNILAGKAPADSDPAPIPAAPESVKPAADMPPVDTPAALPVAPAAPLPSFSIRGAVAEKLQQEKVAAAAAEERHEPFDGDALQKAWQQLAATVENPRLRSALENAPPTIADTTKVVCAMMNVAQKKWLEENMAHTIVDFLRRTLRNDALTLEIVVEAVEHTDAAKTLYTAEQKFNYLREQYPAVQQLKESLKMDTR